jgi:hypothetical protein
MTETQKVPKNRPLPTYPERGNVFDWIVKTAEEERKARSDERASRFITSLSRA